MVIFHCYVSSPEGILTKSSKSSKSWSFSSLCFCACCLRLDLGPQKKPSHFGCVSWATGSQLLLLVENFEVSSLRRSCRPKITTDPKECERKNRCVNVHVLLCGTMSDKKSVNTVLACSSVCTFWTMGYWLWWSKKDDRYWTDESILVDLSNGTMGKFWHIYIGRENRHWTTKSMGSRSDSRAPGAAAFFCAVSKATRSWCFCLCSQCQKWLEKNWI